MLVVGAMAACSSSTEGSDPTVGSSGLGTTAASAASDPPASPTTASPATTLPSTTTTPPTSTTAAALFQPEAVGAVTVGEPPVAGKGATVLGTSVPDLAAVGYVQSEFFVSGTADAYTSAEPLSPDGDWTITPIEPAAFTTRVVVRRPADAADANGKVVVEWFNVTAGFDNAPDWTYTHVEMIRSGWTWVGVSAQAVGINGGGNALGAALALKAADPDRYGSLVHPGDSYSYDIFSQAGAAVRTQWDTLLGGLEPIAVIAIGESQSAFRLTTYVNAVAPIANVFDGYLIHSRGAAGAALSQDPLPAIEGANPSLIRDDVQVPVLNFLSETDMIGDRLGFVRARQPDTDLIRSWEVPGTAHADAYNLGIGDNDDGTGAGDTAMFAAMITPPSSIYGGVITCDLGINAGPHTYVLRSAFAAMSAWVNNGTPPPSMPQIEFDDAGALVLDASGNATGGIRTPHIDVPIARLAGDGQTGESFCRLFGVTQPFSAEQLAAAYPDHATFVAKWNAALDAAVASGAILPSDAEHLGNVAAASTVGG